jgi:hypothetical protein
MELTEFIKIIFTNKEEYKNISSEHKELFFFKFSEYASRVKPIESDSLNFKGINKSIGMDIWFEIFKNDKYIPYNFYPPFKIKEAKKERITVSKKKR